MGSSNTCLSIFNCLCSALSCLFVCFIFVFFLLTIVLSVLRLLIAPLIFQASPVIDSHLRQIISRQMYISSKFSEQNAHNVLTKHMVHVILLVLYAKFQPICLVCLDNDCKELHVLNQCPYIRVDLDSPLFEVCLTNGHKKGIYFRS